MPLTECRRCNGDGRALDPNPYRSGSDWCLGCGGDGRVFVSDASARCNDCGGDGRSTDTHPTVSKVKNWCAGCAGTGYTSVQPKAATTRVRCPRCGGDGNAFDPSPIGKARDFCLGCNGARLVSVADPTATCPQCRGDGKSFDQHPEHDSVTNWCHACQGTGFAG